MDDVLDYPPFPQLKWNDYNWSGEITLPSWAGFQTRRGGYGSVSDQGPSDGTARLHVDSLNADERSLPTPEQAAAFRHLIEFEVAVAASVGQALLEHYPGQRKAYLEDYDLDEAHELPVVKDVAGLRQVIGLANVHVLDVAHDGVAYIGFEFGCAWDGEHGAGVMTHRGRVVAIGHADTSFLGWIAEDDADRVAKRS